jgi:parallel beta helix pectate lyase-like protein
MTREFPVDPGADTTRLGADNTRSFGAAIVRGSQPELRKSSRFALPGPLRRIPGGAITVISAVALLALIAVVVALVVPLLRSGTTASAGGTVPSGPPGQPPVAAADDVKCPPATVTVTDVASLKAALNKATPGTSIQLKDGVYANRFEAKTSGTAEAPIFLCGGPGAVIDGGGVKSGYGFHLSGVSHWRLVGFGIRNSQKGVMADGVQRVVIQGLTVEQVGDEAIHLRKFSSDNVVQGNTIRKTGVRRAEFGEGIYVGSAQSNWCTVTNCKPDSSDRNILRRNNISATTAESIDIKEGTSGGVVNGNTFDGGSMSGPYADSWVDVKGNNWMIEANVGHNARQDGFQTHEVVTGWGAKNEFRGNTAEVNGAGWGFNFAPPNGNILSCNNKVTGAAKGVANVDCR